MLLLCAGFVSAQPGLLPAPPVVFPSSSAVTNTGDEGTIPEGAPDPIDIETPTTAEKGWSSISEQRTVNWNGLFAQSGLLLGIQHGFRLATEQGTRDGLKGPFFKNYWRAVSNLHGWADGDPFYVNFIGHPMEGAVAGYLLVQNDIPAYRYAVFGENREYWRSRLRALAYAYVFSVQFEIGGLSEASIGAVQAVPPQTGFVDHVVTPIIGIGWMIAEDALDKYVIERFESRVHNRYAVALVRGWLNPSRSFANAMKLTVPWHRDTRPGLFGPDPQGEAVRQFIASGNAATSSRANRDRIDNGGAAVAPFQFDIAFQQSQYGGRACPGGGGTSAFRLAQRWQAVLDVGGCKMIGLDSNWSGDSLHYLAGVRWTPWAQGKWSVYLQALGGGEKISHEHMFPAVKAKLYDDWRRAGANPDAIPTQDQYVLATDTNGGSVQGGAGLSYRMNSALQLRVAGVDFRRSWVSELDGLGYNRSVTLSAGFTLRMGTW